MTELDMGRDMKQRFYRLILEKCFHFTSTVRPIKLTDIIPVDVACVLNVLVEHF